MKRFCGVRGLLFWPMLLTLAGGIACSRQIRVPAEQDSTQTDTAPFHDDGAKSDLGLPESPSAAGNSALPDTRLPFHEPQNLPAGTLLIVRLSKPISGKTGARESFQASLAEPVVIEGNTLIPRGAAVSGYVESVRISKLKPRRGYVQLALQSVHMDGHDLPVQTASLFVRRLAQDHISASTFRLEPSHRLTFRLAEPIYTAAGNSLPSR